MEPIKYIFLNFYEIIISKFIKFCLKIFIIIEIYSKSESTRTTDNN